MHFSQRGKKNVLLPTTLGVFAQNIKNWLFALNMMLKTMKS